MAAGAQFAFGRISGRLPGLRLLEPTKCLELSDEGAAVGRHAPKHEVIDFGTASDGLQGYECAAPNRDHRDSLNAGISQPFDCAGHRAGPAIHESVIPLRSG